MALTPIVKPPFPNVPSLPGVPKLPRSPNFPPAIQAAVGYIEGKLWQAAKGQQKWGIYDPKTNAPIAVADSVLEMGYNSSSRISNAPLQKGSFVNYNKVTNPYEAYVTLVKGGGLSILSGRSEDDRQAFLDAIDTAKNSLDLFNVVTPEKTYINCSIQDYSYRREQSSGANMLIVELRLIEVRQVDAQYTKDTAPTQNAQTPSAASTSSNGKVQPKAVPPSLLERIRTGGLSSLFQ